MNKILLVSITAILFILGLASCSGISKADYEAVLNERNIAVNERESIQQDLNISRSEAGKLESQLIDVGKEKSALEAEIKNLEDSLLSAKSNYDSLKVRITKAKLYADILDKVYFVPAFSMTTTDVLETSSMIEDTGNSELMSQWTAYLDSTSDKDYTAWVLATWDGAYSALK